MDKAKRIETLERRVDALEKALAQAVNRESVVETRLILPEADIGGLHFNRQDVRAVFEKRDDGWHCSRDILFLSARNVEGGDSRDILTEYLNMTPAEDARQGLRAQIAEMMGVSSLDVEIFLPQKLDGVKKYHGVNWWHWLADPSAGSADYFCSVSHYGIAGNSYASAVGGCAPVFRVVSRGG
jgi:hypothetical protein